MKCNKDLVTEIRIQRVMNSAHCGDRVVHLYHQCLRNHIHELIALSSVNLTGKIQINASVNHFVKQHQPLLVLAGDKLEGILAATYQVFPEVVC